MNFAAPVFCAGAQLGTFEGRGPILEKGYIVTFQKNIRPVNIVFRFISGENTVGGLRLSLL